MMGSRLVAQSALFYEFCLENHVLNEHLLRSIDRFVDLSDVRTYLTPFYSSTGRPSVDPELMIRMLLAGYCMGIRQNDTCAKRSISTWPIAGSAALICLTRCQIAPRSPRTTTVGSETAICSVTCSRLWLPAALPKTWSAVNVLPSMPV